MLTCLLPPPPPFSFPPFPLSLLRFNPRLSSSPAGKSLLGAQLIGQTVAARPIVADPTAVSSTSSDIHLYVTNPDLVPLDALSDHAATAEPATATEADALPGGAPSTPRASMVADPHSAEPVCVGPPVSHLASDWRCLPYGTSVLTRSPTYLPHVIPVPTISQLGTAERAFVLDCEGTGGSAVPRASASATALSDPERLTLWAERKREYVAVCFPRILFLVSDVVVRGDGCGLPPVALR